MAANISVAWGFGGPTPPGGRRRRRNVHGRVYGDIDPRAEREAERVRRYFDDGYQSYYKYWGIIDTGRWGVALLCRQKKRQKPDREERWLVVKRVFDELMQDKLHKEIEILKRLRGAPHIVQILAIDPDPFEALSRGALIMDYGMAGQREGRRAVIMRMLISLDTTWELPPGEITMPVQGGGERAISTASACVARPNHPHLDDGLRDLVMLCTAVKVEDRPSLDWLWDTLMNLILTRTPAYYAQRNFPWAQLEEDGAIQDLIQYIVYNYGLTDDVGIEAGETEGIE
ncbi:hypothetical protein DL766_000986 [Monosporascus sp. MC13-8B]|nr:hypothetical protein DL766_000986 [Monosporascus sp. MC13-8B]